MKPAQLRVKRILTYIQELTKLRSPPVSNLSSYDWSLKFSSLPSYPSIQTFIVPEKEDAEFDGIILRIKRPKETPCPKPPKELDNWLENGWDKIDSVPSVIPARNISDQKDGQTYTEKFEESSDRVLILNKWLVQKNDWSITEKPAREAGKYFADLFSLHGQLQRESEKYQLYIGDGHLVWQSGIEPVEHPILLKKVELEFNSTIPEFVVRDSDDEANLYTSLLRHHELDGKTILAAKQMLESKPVHPLSDGHCTEFLKFFIQSFFKNGQFKQKKNEVQPQDPSIFRDPTLFIGGRTQGFTEALDKLIESIDEKSEISEALTRIAGVDIHIDPNGENKNDSNEIGLPPIPLDIDFLLTKPANREQERVIERLENTGSVLVQGPPGTGKSHTIANIIGHLLASGKTVLVSSHTSKALKVVRDKVAKDLQPLCVAVLDKDSESKGQLEDSVNGIVSYISSTDNEKISKEIKQLSEKRNQLKLQLKQAESDALSIRKGEYEDIIVGGEAIPPSEAARRVAESAEKDSWIPGLLKPGCSLTLTVSDLVELYKTNSELSYNDELCLAEGLPEASQLIEPGELNELFGHINLILPSDTKILANVWAHSNQDLKKLDDIAFGLSKSLDIFNTHEWVQRIVDETRLSDEHIKPWLSLIGQVNKTTEQIAKNSEIILKHGPQVSCEINESLILTCKNVLAHVKINKKIGILKKAFNSDWATLLKVVRVDAGVPTHEEHFEALIAHMECRLLRDELTRRWERQVVSIGGPRLEGERPEALATSLLHALSHATNWSSNTWKRIEDELKDQGFQLKESIERITAKVAVDSHVNSLKELVNECLVPAINSRKLWVRLKDLKRQKHDTTKAITENLHKTDNASIYLNGMLESIELMDIEQYRKQYGYFLSLHNKQEQFYKRMELLGKLRPIAQTWANSIERRDGIHGCSEMPGDPLKAWKLCQWRQEIDRRTGHDYGKVQRDISRLKTEIQNVNAQYVEKLAWKYQLSRTGLKEKQALTGWQQLQDKIPKNGKGPRAAVLIREAQKTLKDCKNAVPVWIMPLSRVFESFDLVETKFDVLILDEASQSDITALVAFSLCKQVIVVGDKEQVTPSAVGQNLGQIQVLIDTFLSEVPNKLLYDGRTSIYDLAEQSFGGTIRLLEHFRCVPEIIQFSNHLAYGDIRPLRESSSSPFKKKLVAHRIQGAESITKKNKKEALEVASIIAAMTEIEEYKTSSIGVISMVGVEQAILIDTILQRKLSTDLYEKHSLLCGNASQFQGDERDVVLISMVDTCDAPPLSMRQSDDFKKTFNVAASRAKNQLWVVHSLNPSTDLKPGDLRLRLIKHAEDPKALEAQIEATQRKADPKSVVFEPMVIKDLMQAGFRVLPQWKVGAYTIDIVIQGKSKRIALECDGDRYHPAEKLAEDIQRQMVLERLGWKFIRIRGTEYFRNRGATIKRVVAELESLDIERLGPVIEADPEDSSSDELQMKVITRAEEIRKDWEANTDIEENTPKRSRPGKGTLEKLVYPIHENELEEKVQDNRDDLKIKTKKTDSVLPPLNRPVSTDGVVAYLKKNGFEVIDKQSSGGSIWVIDHPGFKQVKKNLEELGLKFVYAPNGGGATKHRPAWYAK